MRTLKHSLAATAALSVLGHPSATQLRPPSRLVNNCYNFPAHNFDIFNSVKNIYGSSPHLVLDIGSSAVDFSLHDIDGQEWSLSNALKNGNGKPVVLIWGMSTCPAYQGLDATESNSRWAYWDELDVVHTYRDNATFVHMYGPEPHPTAPDTNFDSGRLLPNYWSVTRQHVKYEDRVQAATAIRAFTHPDQVILPDYLPDNPYKSGLSQPVWCSYAMGARPVVLISVGGTVFYQQEWLNTDDLGDAIDGYWLQNGEGTWGSEQPTGRLGNNKPHGKRAVSKEKRADAHDEEKQISSVFDESP